MMTPEQKAAFVHAQSVAAYAEIEGMKAENFEAMDRGMIAPHGAPSFRNVPEKYGLHYNQLCAFFQGD